MGFKDCLLGDYFVAIIGFLDSAKMPKNLQLPLIVTMLFALPILILLSCIRVRDVRRGFRRRRMNRGIQGQLTTGDNGLFLVAETPARVYRRNRYVQASAPDVVLQGSEQGRNAQEAERPAGEVHDVDSHVMIRGTCGAASVASGVVNAEGDRRAALRNRETIQIIYSENPVSYDIDGDTTSDDDVIYEDGAQWRLNVDVQPDTIPTLSEHDGFNEGGLVISETYSDDDDEAGIMNAVITDDEKNILLETNEGQ